ncbi:TonB-linked outer membrane protein, SusC/RagA family [Filimonas lacunae]|uniref:TonB-linked outer membrane protein, SusC/RagA family n=1 Tax=Filimonas lacunae TaxID=477680 RepID=A0A173MN84_9BACT|nr:SusC/RagA family TonB-linked outer membrane protein [Filimonas lacunae]BAV09102.1 outer membrane protein, nutrient binding [Filimonas lacunae]SIS67306.1 TonB-linked outer membrane protein, SusC/RagA family [Filimonas lacunae]
MKPFTLLYLLLILTIVNLHPFPLLAQKVNPVVNAWFNNCQLTDAFNQLNKKYNLNISFSKTALAAYTTGYIHYPQIKLADLLKIWSSKLHLQCIVHDQLIIIQPAPRADTSNHVPKTYTFSGKVMNKEGEPLYGAVVTLLNEHKVSTTSEEGMYEITTTHPTNTATISYTGYATAIIYPATTRETVLQPATEQLPAVAIQSGIQKLPAELATGAYNVLTAEALERNNFPGNFLDRISSLTNAISITKNIPLGSIANEGAYSLRGRSTINSNPLPLLIVDNFPFQGNLSDINPNDIESITFLKDATATSIWGAFSSNGVITITTRNASVGKNALKVVSNTTLITKPDVYYTPTLSARSYIEMEQLLYKNNFYDVSPTSTTYLPPAVELLKKEQDHLISTAQLNQQLDSMAHNDIRNDIARYYTQTGFNQQLFISAQGGDDYFKHYYAMGLEKQQDNLTRNGSRQFTLTCKHTHYLLQKRLVLAANLFITRGAVSAINEGAPGLRPYFRLADANGNPLALTTPYRQSFMDTVGKGLLLPWSNKPLQDLRLNNVQTNSTHLRFNLSISYQWKALHINLLYQYTGAADTYLDWKNKQSSYVTTLVNQYSQINYAASTVYRPIPYGDIADKTTNPITAHNGRLLLNYKKHLLPNLNIISMAGADIYTQTNVFTTQRTYNYHTNSMAEQPDYYTSYPLLGKTLSSKIPYVYSEVRYRNNFISYYTNHILTFSNRYSISASIRRDATNLVGANTNNKGVPLWSTGGAWRIDQEPFFKTPAIKELKLRISYGKSGNVDNNVSALASATYSSATNRFKNRIGRITSPQNENLRWEKVSTFNLGIDFTIQNRLNGSIDAYWKKADDLISEGNVDPTLGLTSYVGNFGSMQSKGVDIAIHYTPVLRKSFRWNTSLLLSWNVDRVSKNKYNNPAINEFLGNTALNAPPGTPLYSIYALHYKGLDETGNPVILLNGTPSNNYIALLSSTNINNVKYYGPSRPTIWGSFINTLTFQKLSVSILLSLKAGYYFRRPSITYYTTSTGSNMGHPDFDNRWKKAGDEQNTMIPTFKYPIDINRDVIYTYSNTLVEKADHIRCENIKMSYQLPTCTLSLLCNNLGIIWKANTQGIDPDYIPNGLQRISPPAKTFTFNITLHL